MAEFIEVNKVKPSECLFIDIDGCLQDPLPLVYYRVYMVKMWICVLDTLVFPLGCPRDSRGQRTT